MVRHRRTRRVHRKGTRKATRRMRGGFIQLNPADINDSSMAVASKVNMMQGQEYASIHSGQHGGQNMSMPPTSGGQNMSIPPNHHRMPDGTIMPNSMHKQSGGANNTHKPEFMFLKQQGGVADVGYTGVLDSSLRGAARMDPLDHSYNEIVGMKDQGGGGRRRRARKSGKKSRKSGKSRRKMRGGFAPVDAPTMILQGQEANEAVMAMNPEWKLAETPGSFDPSK